MIVTDQLFVQKLEQYNPMICNQAVRLEAVGRQNGMSFEDLVEAGTVGLWKALRRYDPKVKRKHNGREKAKEGTFFRYRIYGEMIDQMRSGSLIKGIVRDKRLLLRMVSLVSNAEPEELEENELSQDFIVNIRPDALEELMGHERANMVNYCISRLKPRYKFVIQEYYFKGTEMCEIGKQIGMSESLISFNTKDARKCLKEQLVSVGIKEA